MKVVHTSDWHLGRCLHGVDLLDHQAAYLDHLAALVASERPDALLVAGDVFDRAAPPVEAVDLLSEAWSRLAGLTQVVAISGNHDSPARLGFAAACLRPELRVVTALDQVGRPVELTGADGLAGLVYPVPFLDVDLARSRWAGDEGGLERSHQAVLGAAMGRVRADLARRRDPGRPPVVVMAHAFVSGGAGCESERDITVGGVDNVPVEVFAGADYLALGHLHGPQTVNTGGEDWAARYSGSPLAFSFSEAGQTKSTAVVRLEEGSPPRVELVAAPVPRPLVEASGSLADLASRAWDQRRQAWAKVTVTDPVRPPDLYQRVRRLFPHALVVRHEPPDQPANRTTVVVSPARDPLAVAREFVRFVGGGEPTAAEERSLAAGLELARASGSEAR
jgi:exonuclease SbcD